MIRQSVSSSMIAAVGYADPAGVLEVEFNNGGIYQYSGVPRAIFEGLMTAGSKGQYLNAYVKDRYPHRKVR